MGEAGMGVQTGSKKQVSGTDQATHLFFKQHLFILQTVSLLAVCGYHYGFD